MLAQEVGAESWPLSNRSVRLGKNTDVYGLEDVSEIGARKRPDSQEETYGLDAFQATNTRIARLSCWQGKGCVGIRVVADRECPNFRSPWVMPGIVEIRFSLDIWEGFFGEGIRESGSSPVEDESVWEACMRWLWGERWFFWCFLSPASHSSYLRQASLKAFRSWCGSDWCVCQLKRSSRTWPTQALPCISLTKSIDWNKFDQRNGTYNWKLLSIWSKSSLVISRMAFFMRLSWL